MRLAVGFKRRAANGDATWIGMLDDGDGGFVELRD